ncbi:MAG: hypothetical protein U9N55_09965 [candidate division Zixibacteria bacterium]|nr:hypothetical protein [candidate division Zixibacteria bacterium]
MFQLYELSDKEKLLVTRSRKLWYKPFRISIWLFSLIGVLLTAVLIIMTLTNLQQRHAYEEQLVKLRKLAERDSLPDRFMSVTQGESVDELLQTYIDTYVFAIDSLSLSPNILGFVLNIDVHPTSVPGFRSNISQLDLFTDCGCENEGFFNILTLEIDPITTRASVTSSAEAMTLAQYYTLNRHSSKK